MDQQVKSLPYNAGDQTWVQSLGWEDTMEEKMAIHSSVPAWRMPWTEKPGRPQSKGSHRVGHDCSDLAAAAGSLYAHFLERCFFFFLI